MINFIPGGKAEDSRGQIRFVNDFDMSLVKRFYIIKNADTELVRGWRGHQIEQRWFYILSGSFELNLVRIDDWNKASRDLVVERMVLNSAEGRVIHVPAGYATAFRALESGAELLVYADYPLSHAVEDDHTWSLDYFLNYSY